MHELEIYCRDEKLIAASHGPAFITTYPAGIDVETLARAELHHDRLRVTHPRTLVVTFTGMGVAIPGGDVRAASAKLIRDNAHRLLASAIVFAGSGFWVSAARSAMTSILLMARQAVPTRIFADGTHASHWLAQHSDDVHADSLAAALEQYAGAAAAA